MEDDRFRECVKECEYELCRDYGAPPIQCNDFCFEQCIAKLRGAKALEEWRKFQSYKSCLDTCYKACEKEYGYPYDSTKDFDDCYKKCLQDFCSIIYKN